jgi:hypothetical protein
MRQKTKRMKSTLYPPKKLRALVVEVSDLGGHGARDPESTGYFVRLLCLDLAQKGLPRLPRTALSTAPRQLFRRMLVCSP